MLFRLPRGFFRLSFLFFLSTSALAQEIILTPETPYEFDESTVVHYTVSAGLGTMDTDPITGDSFRVLDTTPSAAGGTENLIKITVRPEDLPALPSNANSSDYYLSLRVNATSSSSPAQYVYVPLAYCSSGSCLSGKFTETAGTESTTGASTPGTINTNFNGIYNFAANFSRNGSVTVGFYLDQLCDVASTIFSTSLDICSASTVKTFSSGESAQVQLVALVGASTDIVNSVYTPEPNFNTTVDTGFSVKIHFGPPSSYSCSLVNSYFPGDGAIYLNSENFSLTVATGGAPEQKVVVAGQQTSGSFDSTSFPSNSINVIQGRVSSVNTASEITGFENSTASSDVYYALGIGIRDASGIIAPFDTSCQLTQVQTAAIEGFLRDGNCFIASAAYGKRTGLGLDILRTFRNKILTKFKLGQNFIKMYYRYSPALSEWIYQSPFLRVLVLFFLIPIQIYSALLILNPVVWMGILGFMGIGLGGLSWFIKKEKKF